MMGHLDPQLEQYRVPYEKLNRLKQALAVGFFFVIVVAMVLVPHERATVVFVILFGTLMVCFGGVEIQKYRLFMRDVRERERMGE